jgi:CheY-like chemotaxis protein
VKLNSAPQNQYYQPGKKSQKTTFCADPNNCICAPVKDTFMLRILVVDDHDFVRAGILFALKSNGFDAVAAENSAAAFRAIKRSKFDLAIVDIYMPSVDGVKLIKAIRAHDPRILVIAMSGVQIPISGRTALDLFPLATNLADIVCLKKPFRRSELMQAISKTIAAAKSTTENAIP